MLKINSRLMSTPCDENMSNQVKVWLLIKMKEQFPSCVIRNDQDHEDTVIYGIPKALEGYLSGSYIREFKTWISNSSQTLS